jgi:OOP family OmpA-OmpF porin
MIRTRTHKKRKGANMKTNRIITKVLVLIAGVVVVLCASSQAQAETVTIKGVIVSRDGDNMLLSSDRGKVTVTITQDTKVKLVKGMLGIRYETMGMAALIPGLRVEVKAEFSNNQYTAKTVKFRGDDLKTAMAIQAGMEMTQQQVQANKEGVAKGEAEDEAIKKRFSELKDYDVKGTLTIN